MLTIYRRHRKNCKQRAKGRKYRHCQCPVWVDGTLGGNQIRESLKVRDWQRAQEMIREWEAEDRRTRQQEQQITIKNAHEKFIADAVARKLNDSTLYKYRLLFRQLDGFAEAYKLQFLTELDLDTLATFRATWTEEPGLRDGRCGAASGGAAPAPGTVRHWRFQGGDSLPQPVGGAPARRGLLHP